MAEKSDLEQLRGILSQFDEKTIQAAVGELGANKVCRKTIDDFPDPGRALKPGEDSVVPFDELSVMERLIGVERNLLPVHFLEEGAVVLRPVARVAFKGGGDPLQRGWGTGFLVSESLFMTNNHVIDSADRADDFQAEFNYQFNYDGTEDTPVAFLFDPEDVSRPSAIPGSARPAGATRGLGKAPPNTATHSIPAPGCRRPGSAFPVFRTAASTPVPHGAT